MTVWEAMTSGAFEEILQKGRHPGQDWDAGVENAKAREMMAEFLLDELFWKGRFTKDAIEFTVVCVQWLKVVFFGLMCAAEPDVVERCPGGEQAFCCQERE